MAKKSIRSISGSSDLTAAQVLAIAGTVSSADVKAAKEALSDETGPASLLSSGSRTFRADPFTLTIDSAGVEVEGQTERSPTVNVLSLQAVGTILHYAGITRESAVTLLLAVSGNLSRGDNDVVADRLASSKPEGAKFAAAFKAALADCDKVPKNGRTFTDVTGKVEQD